MFYLLFYSLCVYKQREELKQKQKLERQKEIQKKREQEANKKNEDKIKDPEKVCIWREAFKSEAVLTGICKTAIPLT